MKGAASGREQHHQSHCVDFDVASVRVEIRTWRTEFPDHIA
jgi:hypothetical protein